ncbi:DUF190 domain-containing protein [Sphingobium sp. BHU LFT2]|uniref:DUF190 domain-containing protein n=1 Tax=Sphingobium sp. BHU LFT2 TaxID=2807634 RepID=UPI001BE4EC35|nr:DUF190 domain-containing protein [Sphingobium sp. BHU LFT2]MBT2246156.1 DUF190 domain-containing protein [Sphingobium sp. BHU LFT2]
MTDLHHVRAAEIGMLRIYMKPSDKLSKGTFRTLWSSKPLYRELVQRAKAQGLLNAIVHHTHYGYSDRGQIRESGAEISDPHLTICVELIDERSELERFCAAQGELLSDKVIIYKHIEHWRLGRGSGTRQGAAFVEVEIEG